MYDNLYFVNLKNTNIKDCENFKRYLEDNFYFSNFENIRKLYYLLDYKISLYNQISNENLVHIKNALDFQDEKICNQIYIVKNEIYSDFITTNDTNLFELIEAKKIKYKKIAEEFDSKKFTQEPYQQKNFDIFHTSYITNKSLLNFKESIAKNVYFEKYINEVVKNEKIEAFKAIWHFIKNHQWISTAVFFGLGIFVFIGNFISTIGHVPILSQGEIMSISVNISVILLFFSACFIFSILLFYYAYILDVEAESFSKKNRYYFFYCKSLFGHLIAIILFFYQLYIIILLTKLNMLPEFILNHPYISLLIMAILSIVIINIFFNFINNEIVQIISLFITLISIIIPFMIQAGIVSLLIALFVLLMLIALFGKEEKKSFTRMYIMIFILAYFSGAFLLSNTLFKYLNYGNIEYKTLTLNKKAKDAIPKKIYSNKYFCILQNETFYSQNRYICLQDINITSYIEGNFTYIKNNSSHTIKEINRSSFEFYVNNKSIKDVPNDINYTDFTLSFIDTNKQKKIYKNVTIKSNYKTYIAQDTNDTIKLHNVKALSALGKFYYLQSTNKERFEILSTYIIGKDKR